MIRRELQTNGSPFAWLLIDQIAHARIAAELAQHWVGLDHHMAPAMLIPTIDHHDDGWVRWDSRPTRDPQSGIPRDFKEMVPRQAQRIWSDSIEAVGKFGPLAEHMVAEHFLTLAVSGGESALAAETRQFVDDFQPRSANWYDTWLNTEQTADLISDNVAELAATAVRMLQFFDWLSLLLCCEPLANRRTILQWQDKPITLIPLDQRGEALTIEPWPFSGSQMSLETGGRLIPAQPLASDEQLWEVLESAPRLSCRWYLEAPQ